MQLIYHPTKDYPWTDFGIDIPLTPNRAKQVLALLEQSLGTGLQVTTQFSQEIKKWDLEKVHTQEFIQKLYSDKCDQEILKAYELVNEEGEYCRYNPQKAIRPLREKFDLALLHAAGTFEAGSLALEHGAAYFLGGGMHHAMSFGGRGFCLFNDLVVAAKKLQEQKNLKKIWIVDVDAHKGDGTAEVTEKDTSIDTLSIHMANGWPLVGEKRNEKGELHPWFIPSTLDIPIASGEEHLYLSKLEDGLNFLYDKGRADLVFVVNGADPFEEDVLESTKSLNLDKETLLKRDLLLYNKFRDWGIPQAYVMAGGYGPKSYEIYAQFLIKVL